MSKRVAISVESMNGLESIVDLRFGRAFAYVVVDIDTNSVVVELENKTRQAAQGAGTGAAGELARNNVNAVISGRFGPKAFQALNSFGIELWTVSERITAREAIERYVSGNLTSEASPSGNPSVEMGGGQGLGQGGGVGMGGGSGMGRGGGAGMGGGGRGMGGGRGVGGGGRGMGGGGRGRGVGNGGRGMGGGGGGGGKGK